MRVLISGVAKEIEGLPDGFFRELTKTFLDASEKCKVLVLMMLIMNTPMQ